MNKKNALLKTAAIDWQKVKNDSITQGMGSATLVGGAGLIGSTIGSGIGMFLQRKKKKEKTPFWINHKNPEKSSVTDVVGGAGLRGALLGGVIGVGLGGGLSLIEELRNKKQNKIGF